MPNNLEMKRSNFLKLMALGTTALSMGYFFSSLNNEKNVSKIKLKLTFPNFKLGHKLWKIFILPNSETIRVDTVIVGGGISGLSAAHYLKKNNKPFLLLELEKTAGGNSSFGENEVSKYPLGAHYLPLPGLHQKELIDFLVEVDAIKSFKNGLPVYNEEYLCNAPEDRLLINGRWQEGLIPHFGISENDKKQINSFIEYTKKLQAQKGNDDKYVFDLPLIACSTDDEFLAYDKVTMFDFLISKSWDSQVLHQYVDYCCKDDFGIGIKEVSAWVGLHYFAGRKALAANASGSEVLTWPNGNGFLMNFMADKIQSEIKNQCLVYEIIENNGEYLVSYFDDAVQKKKSIHCKNVIVACPQFVLKHLKTDVDEIIIRKKMSFDYTSWLVATCKVKNNLLNNGGVSLAWDNVSLGVDNLGYVVSNHQDINLNKPYLNLTFYKVFDDSIIRKQLLKSNEAFFNDMIVSEMSHYHENFEEICEEIHSHIWGHAMSKSQVNKITELLKLSAINKKSSIQFAHCDWGGMSLFEEAFYQGLNAAKNVVNQ